MNIQTLTVGLLRLLTLVIVYYIVIQISHLIYNISYSDWSTLFMSVTALTFLTVAAIVFWFYPMQFSNLLFKNTESSGASNIKSIELVHAGVIILGLSLFTLALIDLAQWFIYYGIMNFPPEIHQGNMLKVGLFYIVARLIIAVLLLTKSYWLTTFLLKLNSPINWETD